MEKKETNRDHKYARQNCLFVDQGQLIRKYKDVPFTEKSFIYDSEMFHGLKSLFLKKSKAPIAERFFKDFGIYI